MISEKFTSEREVPQETKESELKIEGLSISDFAREIGLQADEQGRFKFGPEHDQPAYEYAENFVRKKKAEAILIDGVASPGVIASLLHGAHPAEGYLTYMSKDAEGKMVKGEVKILEPLPEAEGKGPEYLTWSKEETDEYTLVEFNLSGNFEVSDLDKVVPPEVDPSKPVIISGRGPLYLTHTIAAAYRHYKGIPAVGFYQPASKFGPAKTEIGISHSEEFPLGLNFGEPKEIGAAKERYWKELEENIGRVVGDIKEGRVRSIDCLGNRMRITNNKGEVFEIIVRDVIKGKIEAGEEKENI